MKTDAEAKMLRHHLHNLHIMPHKTAIIFFWSTSVAELCIDQSYHMLHVGEVKRVIECLSSWEGRIWRYVQGCNYVLCCADVNTFVIIVLMQTLESLWI